MCVLAILLIPANIIIQSLSKVKTAEKINRECNIMSKKIVVITGSPRKKGNSFAMTNAFIQAAQAKGHGDIEGNGKLAEAHQLGRSIR